mmetsp:Transcript_3990/g.6768  ORF Transcript_3990/g.6768 Transcript_3990/m.6768 type:complete len:201 (+) Transcript_3990:84-686(+)
MSMRLAICLSLYCMFALASASSMCGAHEDCSSCTTDFCQWLSIAGGEAGEGYCYYSTYDVSTNITNDNEWITLSSLCPANSFRRGGPCGDYYSCTSCISAPVELDSNDTVTCEWDLSYDSCVMTNDTVPHNGVNDEELCPSVILGKIVAIGVAAIIGITCGVCVLCACCCAAIFIFLVQPRRKRGQGNVQANYAQMPNQV